MYCQAHAISGDLRDDMFYHVERLDAAYIKWCAKKTKQKIDNNKPPPRNRKR